MNGEVVVPRQSYPAAATEARASTARRHSEFHGDHKASRDHHCKAAKKQSKRDKKERKDRRRRRRASVDSPYDAPLGQTDPRRPLIDQAPPQQQHGTRSRDDSVAELFATAGVGVSRREQRCSQPDLILPVGSSGYGSYTDYARSAAQQRPDVSAATTAGRPVFASGGPAALAPAPALAPAAAPVAHTRRASSLDNEVVKPGRAAPAAALAQDSVVRASVSAPSLADLCPASIGLSMSSSEPPLLGAAGLGFEDDGVTPRTRRIGAFAKKQAAAGGFAAGVSAAPVRMMPQ